MRFYLKEHQGKGARYAEALRQHGWQQVETAGASGIDAALYDHDFNGAGGFRPDFQHLEREGTQIFIYPHSARPQLWWDGMYPVYPRTKMVILTAPGHLEVMQAYGYPKPMEVCGWSMSDLVPFMPREPNGKIRVLFMPIHPNNNGWMHDAMKAINALVLTRLLETPGIELTIRHVKRLDLNGIWQDPRARYVLANPNGSTAEIDEADVVVAHQTAAYLAVARGKPLLMFGDDIRPHSGSQPGSVVWAKNWEAYRELMRYPLEMERLVFGGAVREALEQAMGADVGAEWRAKFVGEPLDYAKFEQVIRRYVFGN